MQSHKFTFEGQRVRLTTAFDNGSLARVEERARDVFDCWPYEKDEYREGGIRLARWDGADEAWDSANFSFQFRLDGCRNKKVVLRFHVLEVRSKDGVSVLYANPDFPVYSYDRRKWRRTVEKSLIADPEGEGGQIVQVEQTFEEDTVWFAYQYPYSNDQLSDFIGRAAGSAFLGTALAGRSTEGRDIRQIRVTDPAVPLSEKTVVWLIGLQHCAEPGAGWGLEGMIEFLLSADAVAAEARRKCLFNVIPIVNVDAVAEGRGRIHSSGRNLNREWERPDPVTEIATIRKTLDDWKARGNPVDIFMDIHGFSSRAGTWTAPIMPEGSYAAKQAEEHGRLQEAIRRYIPQIRFPRSDMAGLARSAACRRWGALEVTFDGWVYGRPSAKTPDLSSFYGHGGTILDLHEIRAAGDLLVRALVDFVSG